MMDRMMPEMMWGMGLIWLLIIVVLILSAAALVKYLFSGRKGDRQ
jgi:tellurite resistance protein TehA-like permease